MDRICRCDTHSDPHSNASHRKKAAKTQRPNSMLPVAALATFTLAALVGPCPSAPLTTVPRATAPNMVLIETPQLAKFRKPTLPRFFARIPSFSFRARWRQSAMASKPSVAACARNLAEDSWEDRLLPTNKAPAKRSRDLTETNWERLLP